MKLTDKIAWENFDKIHVIKRLKELIAHWWGIQLNFTDEKGFIKGVPSGKFFNPINPICQAVTGTQAGFKGCLASVKQGTVEVKNQNNAKYKKCHMGFSTLSVPIKKDNDFFGCIFADGFVILETEKEQKLQIKNHLIKHDFFNQEKYKLDEFISKIPVLTELETTYLTQLIHMIVDEILLTHSHLFEMKKEVKKLKDELGMRYRFDQMIGKSEPMQQLYRMLEKVSHSSALVLIQGENGTGKELIAKAIHHHSKRKESPFIAINCGAFNDNLLESELFGHVKGAFTGAIKDKEGLFQAASNGTIFLDEIGDTSPVMQVKLLRLLQEQTFTKVGSTETEKSSARVVCATNKNLEHMVKEGSFREDLFYRLHVIHLNVPPLRERREDIPILIEHFLKKFAKSNHLPIKKISSHFLSKLLDHDWPGNVRELENELERLCVLSGEDEFLDEVFLSKRIADQIGAVPTSSLASFTQDQIINLKEATEHLEKDLILKGLKRTKGNKSKLAKELGISRANLISKVDRYKTDKD